MKGTGGSMHGKPQSVHPQKTATEGSVTSSGIPAPPATVERTQAIAFSRILRTLLQQRSYFLPLTGTYLLPQFSLRLQSVDGFGINADTLGAYLRGEIFPSERKVRLMADALEVPRGVLLFAAGYLRLEDLPDYPGGQTSLDAVLAEIGAGRTGPPFSRCSFWKCRWADQYLLPGDISVSDNAFSRVHGRSRAGFTTTAFGAYLVKFTTL
jgi:hypothetical protein